MYSPEGEYIFSKKIFLDELLISWKYKNWKYESVSI